LAIALVPTFIVPDEIQTRALDIGFDPEGTQLLIACPLD
jgi:hypothetical protein